MYIPLEEIKSKCLAVRVQFGREMRKVDSQEMIFM